MEKDKRRTKKVRAFTARYVSPRSLVTTLCPPRSLVTTLCPPRSLVTTLCVVTPARTLRVLRSQADSTRRRASKPRVPTQSVGTRRRKVGGGGGWSASSTRITPARTLCVLRSQADSTRRRASRPCVPTQSVGTRRCRTESASPAEVTLFPRYDALRRNASPDALRPLFPSRQHSTQSVETARSHAERGNEEAHEEAPWERDCAMRSVRAMSYKPIPPLLPPAPPLWRSLPAARSPASRRSG